ncbi:response regulator [Corynebacterium nasicanis]|uniref:Response regulator n=1 Tax=Corynebacterium nasicanis TaxID=1448267 RepID=A0ABW1QD52_9CORY
MRSLLIVDDEEVIRQSLPAYFEKVDEIDVVGTAANGAEALRYLRAQRCDAVLSDIRMPDMNGVELLEALRDLPQPPVFIAMTGLDFDDVMMDLLARGAAGFVGKTESAADVVAAVTDALGGGTGLSPRRVSRLVEITLGKRQLLRRRRSIAIGVTEEEEAILDLLLEGSTNATIAEHLHYAESTIKRKVSVLLRKFGVVNRAELIAKSAFFR